MTLIRIMVAMVGNLLTSKEQTPSRSCGTALLLQVHLAVIKPNSILFVQTHSDSLFLPLHTCVDSIPLRLSFVFCSPVYRMFSPKSCSVVTPTNSGKRKAPTAPSDCTSVSYLLSRVNIDSFPSSPSFTPVKGQIVDYAILPGCYV